ncbi:MAG: efflux RND transporter periplasmic adaptor subunit [Dehalococcoidia bacterium]
MLVAKIDDRMVDQQIQVVGVEQAQVLRVQKQNYTLLSPMAGIVLRVPARVGELAAPGRVLVTVGRLDRLKMTIYVREADLGRVAVGQRLTITADPFPGQSFEGTVTSINQRAEFTPRNVQTRTDRLNLVFGVQATVDNPDGALKPGMPVDARFEPEAAP